MYIKKYEHRANTAEVSNRPAVTVGFLHKTFCSFINEVIVFIGKARPTFYLCLLFGPTVLTEPKVRLSATKALIRDQTGTKLPMLQILADRSTH